MLDALKNTNGNTAIEYALIAGLIALVIIAALTTLGTELAGFFTSLSGEMEEASGN